MAVPTNSALFEGKGGDFGFSLSLQDSSPSGVEFDNCDLELLETQERRNITHFSAVEHIPHTAPCLDSLK